MKIDENCVNHNALRLIKHELLAKTDDFDSEYLKDILMGKLTYIKGIVDMADTMKEVIKDDTRRND